MLAETRHDAHVPLVRLSPFNLPDPRRRFLVLKAYYDGSNKSYELGLMTLAGLAGSNSVWPGFEASWGETLERHGLKWWHSADVMSRKAKRDFLKPGAQAWDCRRAVEAMKDLAKLIEDFWRQDGPQILTCTIDLSGYREASRRNQWLRSAEAICINVCVGGLRVKPLDCPMLLYFDRGELFLKEIDQVWRKDRKKQWLIWPHQIKVIRYLDWQNTYALQAADLLAWSANRHHRLATEEGAGCFDAMNRVHAFYGREEIEAEYTPERERDRLERQRRSGRQTKAT